MTTRSQSREMLELREELKQMRSDFMDLSESMCTRIALIVDLRRQHNEMMAKVQQLEAQLADLPWVKVEDDAADKMWSMRQSMMRYKKKKQTVEAELAIMEKRLAHQMNETMRLRAELAQCKQSRKKYRDEVLSKHQENEFLNYDPPSSSSD